MNWPDAAPLTAALLPAPSVSEQQQEQMIVANTNSSACSLDKDLVDAPAVDLVLSKDEVGSVTDTRPDTFPSSGSCSRTEVSRVTPSKR